MYQNYTKNKCFIKHVYKMAFDFPIISITIKNCTVIIYYY